MIFFSIYFCFPAVLILESRVRKGRRIQRGEVLRLIRDPFSDTESEKISLGCQAAKSRNPESPIPVPETQSASIGTHNKTPSVVAMRVNNPDRPPARING
jgi:hypothetical protein